MKKKKAAKKAAKPAKPEQKRKEDPVIKKQAEMAHRSNWEANHADLAEAYITFVKNESRRPTIDELSTLTGLHYNTVLNHLKTLEQKDFAEKWKSFKLLSEQVILSQAVNAIKGGRGAAASAKLFLEVVEQFRPGLKIELEGRLKLQNMSTEELIERHKEHGKLINSKLIRLTRDSGGIRRTG